MTLEVLGVDDIFWGGGVFGLLFGVFMLSKGLWDKCFGEFVRSMGSVFFCGWGIFDFISVCLVVSAL